MNSGPVPVSVVTTCAMTPTVPASPRADDQPARERISHEVGQHSGGCSCEKDDKDQKPPPAPQEGAVSSAGFATRVAAGAFVTGQHPGPNSLHRRPP